MGRKIRYLKRGKKFPSFLFSYFGFGRGAAAMFCSKIFAALLFLALILTSIFFLKNSPFSGTFASREKIDNLFLGKVPESNLLALPLNFVEENSLKSISIAQLPSGRVLGTAALSFSERPREGIFEYVVKPGDNLSSLAKKFGISLSTILQANNLSLNSLLKPGQKLIILPVSGVLHYVKKGETLSGLAQYYGVKAEEIAAFNDLGPEGKIFRGDPLIIPGAKISQRSSLQNKAPALPLPKTLFICPIASPCRITQGLHWYNAVDLGHSKCGEAVFAVAGGKVQKTGFHRVAGRYIRLLHPSGVVTFYGHLSKILVSPGQEISQGQIIGYTGYSGYTIPPGPAGCHLHFEVRGAKNPFAYY